MTRPKRGKKAVNKARTPIRRALRDDSTLHPLVSDGLAALAQAHRGLLDDAVKHHFADSLNLDAALESAHPTENRWDYLLGHSPTMEVIALEPHTANDKEVSVLKAKRDAARHQLRQHLRVGVQIAAWIWVTKGKVGFAQTEKMARQLDQSGITFAGRKVLAKHLPKA